MRVLKLDGREVHSAIKGRCQKVAARAVAMTPDLLPLVRYGFVLEARDA